MVTDLLALRLRIFLFQVLMRRSVADCWMPRADCWSTPAI